MSYLYAQARSLVVTNDVSISHDANHDANHDNKHMVALNPNAENGYALASPLSEVRSSPLSASSFTALASTNVTVKPFKPCLELLS